MYLRERLRKRDSSHPLVHPPNVPKSQDRGWELRVHLDLWCRKQGLSHWSHHLASQGRRPGAKPWSQEVSPGVSPHNSIIIPKAQTQLYFEWDLWKWTPEERFPKEVRAEWTHRQWWVAHQQRFTGAGQSAAVTLERTVPPQWYRCNPGSPSSVCALETEGEAGHAAPGLCLQLLLACHAFLDILLFCSDASQTNKHNLSVTNSVTLCIY